MGGMQREGSMNISMHQQHLAHLAQHAAQGQSPSGQHPNSVHSQQGQQPQQIQAGLNGAQAAAAAAARRNAAMGGLGGLGGLGGMGGPSGSSTLPNSSLSSGAPTSNAVILSRLQGEVQKSRETGLELAGVGGTLGEVVVLDGRWIGGGSPSFRVRLFTMAAFFVKLTESQRDGIKFCDLARWRDNGDEPIASRVLHSKLDDRVTRLMGMILNDWEVQDPRTTTHARGARTSLSRVDQDHRATTFGSGCLSRGLSANQLPNCPAHLPPAKPLMPTAPSSRDNLSKLSSADALASFTTGTPQALISTLQSQLTEDYVVVTWARAVEWFNEAVAVEQHKREGFEEELVTLARVVGGGLEVEGLEALEGNQRERESPLVDDEDEYMSDQERREIEPRSTRAASSPHQAQDCSLRIVTGDTAVSDDARSHTQEDDRPRHFLDEPHPLGTDEGVIASAIGLGAQKIIQADRRVGSLDGTTLTSVNNPGSNFSPTKRRVNPLERDGTDELDPALLFGSQAGTGDHASSQTGKSCKQPFILVNVQTAMGVMLLSVATAAVMCKVTPE
ncbi:hypothetical protein D9619_008282 [Psilocybe cf. subviscida]|uniref:Uncharacterized protein n=1 Tax=Psilocybe cf. subviscida TaxID=2480587 RepID=A0A8H5B9R8_9AGAR|nr:hypothetical protein D9619_008282 [Psilocybe cf. subviscida]